MSLNYEHSLTIVLFIFMLSFVFVIVCGLLEWKLIKSICRGFLSFIYTCILGCYSA